ncbi:hypothetical protein L2E82_44634 [Cichorium intybus]|uniref:Uncharacterized protein n=1 Tax=Cichorium intybus TaxID=13427 RepID=A0ACB8ZRB1_CICIN|nr:hypothetical protein L2E82_44634 [Cichorium intybus]
MYYLDFSSRKTEVADVSRCVGDSVRETFRRCLDLYLCHRAADWGLPLIIISLRRDYLDITEQDYYTSLYSESQAQFNT